MSRNSSKLRFFQPTAAAAINFFSASSSNLSLRPYSFSSFIFGTLLMRFHSSAL